MLFQRVNRSDPEKVFIVAKNSSATAMTVGQVCCWDYTTDADGVGVVIPSTALLAMMAGIVETASIAAGDYGLIQVYGHNANALVTGTTDVAVGDKLAVKDAVSYLIKSAGTLVAAESGIIMAGEAYTTAGAAAKKVFIRAM